MAVLFIIPDFPNPNIHYSFFILSRYPLLIIQLPLKFSHNLFGSMGLNAERYVHNRGQTSFNDASGIWSYFSAKIFDIFFLN